jgi:hypothetical protein
VKSSTWDDAILTEHRAYLRDDAAIAAMVNDGGRDVLESGLHATENKDRSTVEA